jgi:hypothetical protein
MTHYQAGLSMQKYRARVVCLKILVAFPTSSSYHYIEWTRQSYKLSNSIRNPQVVKKTGGSITDQIHYTRNAKASNYSAGISTHMR